MPRINGYTIYVAPDGQGCWKGKVYRDDNDKVVAETTTIRLQQVLIRLARRVEVDLGNVAATDATDPTLCIECEQPVDVFHEGGAVSVDGQRWIHARVECLLDHCRRLSLENDLLAQKIAATKKMVPLPAPRDPRPR